MTEWFSSMDVLTKFYWITALISSLLFLFQLLMTFVGGDSADDVGDIDSEIEADTGIGLQFITVKNLISFFTIFGWSGIACIEYQVSTPLTIIISIISGLIMMTIMATMFYYMKKLNDSGTLNYDNAIGVVGEVYLTIGAKHSRMGKVHVKVQGALRELEALSDENDDLKSGTVIKVKSVTENGILIVEQLKS